eukprot:SAG11_NODE_1904_length_4088_cov_3.427676_7_plen_143_part_00
MSCPASSSTISPLSTPGNRLLTEPLCCSPAGPSRTIYALNSAAQLWTCRVGHASAATAAAAATVTVSDWTLAEKELLPRSAGLCITESRQLLSAQADMLWSRSDGADDWAIEAALPEVSAGGSRTVVKTPSRMLKYDRCVCR